VVPGQIGLNIALRKDLEETAEWDARRRTLAQESMPLFENETSDARKPELEHNAVFVTAQSQL